MQLPEEAIMSIIDDDELDEMMRGAVLRERERCAKLCEMLATIQEHSATRIRAKGVEWSALSLEEVARSHRAVALCIRNGFDPDRVDDERQRDAEKINLMQQEMTPDQKRVWPLI